MFKITFKCPVCCKVHEMDVADGDQGLITAINCVHQTFDLSRAVKGMHELKAQTDYFYIQLPKLVHP